MIREVFLLYNTPVTSCYLHQAGHVFRCVHLFVCVHDNSTGNVQIFLKIHYVWSVLPTRPQGHFHKFFWNFPTIHCQIGISSFFTVNTLTVYTTVGVGLSFADDFNVCSLQLSASHHVKPQHPLAGKNRTVTTMHTHY